MRYKLAFIIPFRNRQRNLDLWLDHFENFPAYRSLDASIHIVHQANDELFNRGRLSNIGFMLAGKVDAIVIQDVDLLAVSTDLRFPSTPSHLAKRMSQFNYRIPYENLLGGVSMASTGDYLRTNGFSNQYHNWGGEDDDYYWRCRFSGLDIDWRDGIYYSLHHELNHGGEKPNHERNIQRLADMQAGKIDYTRDGLSNLYFKEISTERLRPRAGKPVTLHHVHFNNHDLDGDAERTAGYEIVSINTGAETTPSPAQQPPADTADGAPDNAALADQILSLCDSDKRVDDITYTLSKDNIESIYPLERDVPRVVAQLASAGILQTRSPRAVEYFRFGEPLPRRTITVTAHNRPHYFKRMLDSLMQNRLEEFHIVFALEPGCDENLELCLNFPHPHKTILINPDKLGVRVNPYSVLEYVFANGSEYNVYLEDDIELSPDALELARWYEGPLQNPDLLMGSLFHNSKMATAGEEDRVLMQRGFNAIAITITASAWHRFFKPQWFNDDHDMVDEGVGWDFSMEGFLNTRPELHFLQPLVSRCRHIGLVGTHSNQYEFQRRQLGDTVIYEGDQVRDFIIAGPAPKA